MCRGADLLIYDTQFTPEEYRQRPHWGHSTPDDALAIAREAGVRRVCLFHHAPMRTDDQLDVIVAATQATSRGAGDPFDVLAAHEGLELVLGEDG
jgi:ribonuclease BN (tRNA processing enzyme)